MVSFRIPPALVIVGALLGACGGGQYSGEAPGAGPSSPGPSASPSPDGGDAQARFERAQEHFEICRVCHVPGGVADVDDGRRLMLSSEGEDDYARIYAGWDEMGRGVESNLIMTMPSGSGERSHSGGDNLWPVDSAAYNAVRDLLACWDDASQCGESTTPGNSGSDNLGLLGSKRGGHLWAEVCEGAPDDTALPADPRTLIQPGSELAGAVVFNTPWMDCSINEARRPNTCGEYRQLYAKGELIGRGQGQPGTAHMFSGDARSGINPLDPASYNSEASLWTLSADQYNNLWRSWTGYAQPPLSRPSNFDELVAQRYGSPLGQAPNPYPLPGEDPNDHNGGSGQLPIGLTQLRDNDGNWTGTIGVKLCSFCHDGQIQGQGEASQVVYGGAGTIGDFTVAFRDFASVGALPFGLLSGVPLTIAANRGTGAIDQFQVGFIAFNNGNPQEFSNTKILLSQAIGNIKSPPWWNMGSRPQKFHGAVLPMDSARIDMAAYYPLIGGPSDAVAWVDESAYAFQIWAESLKAPAYPGPIDEALAQQGAVLFHAKDLWADSLDNPVPAPQNRGNGSCASCHGAYAPRFVNDPAFLPDPRLEGVAANITALTTIGTDPAYAEAMQSLRNADGSTETAFDYNVFLACGIGAAGHTPDNTPVMLAPPLYGVWASAPYFHNASVPNVWGVLDPASERPDIWVRQSAPPPPGLEGRVVSGFDTDLERAYDHQRLGWKYTELDCLQDAVQSAPLLSCNPLPVNLTGDAQESPLQPLLDFLYSNIALSWNLSLDELNVMPLTDQQIENRKVYNTNLYSQDNTGHAFTAVLSDAERRALIEYLKTL